MKLKATALTNDGTIPPGTITGSVQVPVLDNFDPTKVVGRATVYPDGSADIELHAAEQETAKGADGFSIGFVVERERQDGKVRVIERIRPISVSVSPEKLTQLQGKKP
jgi:hypothetical protein